ncbi:CBS domain-containing protein [Acidobacteria bacterium AH-259-D05]|nr:CBS domain-containing protein [Acidobacteria bacterium AH-259-D05]
MKTVDQLLQAKGWDVWSVTPNTSAYDALKVMADKNIGALLVLEADTLVGIFSERDYARKVTLKGKSSKDTPVRKIVTQEITYVRLKQSIQECMELMTNKRIRHLPVIENNQFVGVISIGYVVKAIISEQEFVIG